MANVVIQVQDVCKTFTVRTGDIQVLKKINFEVIQGDFVILIGPSGCGKSTLLHTMLGLEAPTSGNITFLGKDLYADTNEDDRSEFRKYHIGMVYQQPNWIKSLTVIENVAFPLVLSGKDIPEGLLQAEAILDSVAMKNWAHYAPTELSSGQQQRIALARALATDPEVIIADEPTGNLDYEAGQDLMQMLVDLNKQNKTIIMVTHDLEYLKYAKTAVRMFNGEIVGVYDESNKQSLMDEIRGKSKRGVTYDSMTL